MKEEMFDYYRKSESKPTWKSYTGLLLLLLAIGLVFRVIVYALSNPAFTHTQVFLAMLPFEVAAIFAALIGSIIFGHEQD